MNPKQTKQFRHDRQVFNQEYSEFVLYYEKTLAGEITVEEAKKILGMNREQWRSLKKKYSDFNGLNK